MDKRNRNFEQTDYIYEQFPNLVWLLFEVSLKTIQKHDLGIWNGNKITWDRLNYFGTKLCGGHVPKEFENLEFITELEEIAKQFRLKLKQ